MRGVFNLRPPIPRYEEIWDVRIVLNYLRQLSPAKDLPLKSLTLKVCMLVALVSGQRVQTLKKTENCLTNNQSKFYCYLCKGFVETKQTRQHWVCCKIACISTGAETLCLYLS